MEQYIAIIISVGTLLPLLTSVIQQPSWSNKTRTFAGIGVSILAGLVTYVTQYGLDVSNPSAIVAAVVGVTLASAAAYKGIWKTVGATAVIEKNVLNVRPGSDETVIVDDEAVPTFEEDTR